MNVVGSHIQKRIKTPPIYFQDATYTNFFNPQLEIIPRSCWSLIPGKLLING